MIKNIRIGNIEFRENQGGEIVEWLPNSYYGKENEYKYDETRGSYYKQEGCYIHPSVFEGREKCCVIAFVRREDEFRIDPVGIRPWELEGKNMRDFTKIVHIIWGYDEEEE